MPKIVRTRVRSFGGQAEQDLNLFIEAKLNGQKPRRLDKPCGFDRRGALLCQMHVDLGLAHYRLTDHPDPLLIYQETPELLSVAAVATHEDIFHGNDLAWCHAWHRTLIWDGNENHLEALIQQFGPLP